jgi:hypothetical protein
VAALKFEDPFANIPPGRENDYRLLLERVYRAIAAEIEIKFNMVRQKWGEHEIRIKKVEKEVEGIKPCPCGKRHDPKTPCPLYLLENAVYRSKARNAGWAAGFFTAGALFYYLAQLAFQALKAWG